MIILSRTTHHLVLRAFAENDADSLYRLLRGKDMLRYFPRTDPPSLERVRRLVKNYIDHWQENGYGLWAVTSRSTGELMGRCGLQYLPDTKETEIDFLLGRPFWGQGYATEAGRASLRYGFQELRLERVVGIVHPDNAASKRVLEKLGLAFAEERIYFGMRCHRYLIERVQFEEAISRKDEKVCSQRT
jgi:ribosomal-protein-alanine N-acetyltransferase